MHRTKRGEASNMSWVEFHADDYGLFPAQSQRILDCYYHGRLNGISILPNSSDLAACMALLGPIPKDMAVTVHLNLIEGFCLSDPKQIPLLADKRGVLCGSFVKLLISSFLPCRKELRRQLREELSRQIRAVTAYLPEGKALRLDGHAHYHMIPVVFDALVDVIQEEGLNVSYIRIPKEPISLYLRHLNHLTGVSFINMVKVFILNLLAWRAQRRYSSLLAKVESKIFLGVFLSGSMYPENVQVLLGDAMQMAGQSGQGLEILAHPGGVQEPEDIVRLTSPEDRIFLTSDNRGREAALFTCDLT